MVKKWKSLLKTLPLFFNVLANYEYYIPDEHDSPNNKGHFFFFFFGAEYIYKRPLFQRVMKRATDSRTFMQVLAGPRQVGQTTLPHQITENLSCPSHYDFDYVRVVCGKLHDNLLLIKAWIRKCSRNPLTILLRHTYRSRYGIPILTNVLKHRLNNDFSLILFQKKT